MAPTHLVDSDSDSDSDANLSFKVNQSFADKYDSKKRTEELSKLQDKYGKDYQLPSDDDDDSEDLSSDDDDAEFVTPQVDAAILATLAKIRNRDPAVYDAERNVFDEEEARTTAFSSSSRANKSSSSAKPVLLKDYQRARLLANPEDDDALDTASLALTNGGAVGPTPVEEQAQLRREMAAAFRGGASSDDEGFGAAGGESEDEEGGLFTKRKKGEDERVKEEKEYERFLETAVGRKAVKEALADEEAFLRDYILNRGWIDREDESHVPSYDEIVGDAPAKKKKKKAKSTLLDDDDEGKTLDPGAHDEEDEEYEERADEYETRYNFRFEEAAGAELITHSRGAVSSVRKPTATMNARQRAREAQKERKEEEKLQRKEEVRRLKALKRKEVEDKLKQLVEAAGAGTKGLEEMDLEGEWDEKKHEEEMKKIYGEEYDAMEDDGFKPTWDDDIDITDIVGPDGGSDDSDGDLDDEVALHLPVASTSALPLDEEEDEGETIGKRGKKKDKGKAKKAKRDDEGFPTELLERAKAGGDAERAQLLERMVDDYYALDYEDKVGDLKTRFRYAKVQPTSFNLSAEEILLATDAELNAFMSLKKMAPYRQDSAAWQRKQADKQRKKLKELRDVLRRRKWGEEVDEDEAKAQLEKRKEKKRKWKAQAEAKDGGEAGGEGEGAGEPAKKRKRAGKSERKRLKAQAAEGGQEE
ncbi:hypothetical protein JCM10207_002341 [Rhodosporidiobolus poonsookiae]